MRVCSFLLAVSLCAPALGQTLTAPPSSNSAAAISLTRWQSPAAVADEDESSPSTPPVRLPAVDVMPAEYLDAPAAAASPSMAQIKAEMKKLVWKKGDFTITPYGFLWANMVYETERSNIGDYTLWVFSAQDEGQPTFHCDAKSTRIGLDIAGPRIPLFCDAKSGGKVEVDFQGTFVTENKGSLLLRHAYWEVKDQDFRLLAGQTWDVISPLYPNTIMYSVYWDAGNIGYRRAQFRGERYFTFANLLRLTFQGSLNADILSETSGTNYTGDQSGWPTLEGRAAITFGDLSPCGHPIEFGVSGHIGEQRFDFLGPNPAMNVPERTWSCCLDLKAPITDRLGFQGEFFMGDNLGAYLGGIGQGVDLTLRRPIYSHGGWMEIWYDLTEKLHAHVGYTVDNPNENDISVATARRYNSVYWGNLVYDITKKFTVGLEVGSWRTLYVNREPGEDVRVEFMAKYGF